MRQLRERIVYNVKVSYNVFLRKINIHFILFARVCIYNYIQNTALLITHVLSDTECEMMGVLLIKLIKVLWKIETIVIIRIY